MKKSSTVLLIIIIAVLLASCRQTVQPIEEQSPAPSITDASPSAADITPPSATDTAAPPTATPSTSPDTPPDTPPETTSAAQPETMLTEGFKTELVNIWARIDGSTATIPLTEALYGTIQGGTQPPVHNATSNAYYHLLYSLDTDLIFVTYPSESELQMVKDLKVPIEIIPIVKDALVFLVNVENPVDDISMQQLRDIYTGRITNWSELGGTNESIIPYQRPIDSGSQTLLLKLLMEGMDPMDAPTEWVVESMGGLVESVSSYDNSKNAIGYSMFYYVNNMYGNNRFKLLGIDGTAPTRDTITKGQYAMEDYYYAVIRKDTPEDSPVRSLINWLLTDEGQAIAAKAGYIPLRPLDGVSPEYAIDPVYLGDTENSSGTGGSELKVWTENTQEVGSVRPPLSSMFYDGFNYIQYINAEIMARLDHVEYDIWPQISEGEWDLIRPFTGIPNNYPNYEFLDYGYYRFIVVELPAGNPFFKEPKSFYINLTEDISPYGAGGVSYTVAYDYAGHLSPQINLFTLRVDIPGRADVATRINEQIIAWVNDFPDAGYKVKMLDDFVEWYCGLGIAVYDLQPSAGLWRDYLSVHYSLHTPGGPMFYSTPMIYSICFDINTGEEVNLAGMLPADPDYSSAYIYTLPNFDDLEEYGFPYQESMLERYTPAAGSIVTDAWVNGESVYMYLVETTGRVLQVCFQEMP